MSDKKPLVIGDDGRPQQLQGRDDVDIPLVDRVERLERFVRAIAPHLLEMNIEIPEDCL